jgi:hypothetical protein
MNLDRDTVKAAIRARVIELARSLGMDARDIADDDVITDLYLTDQSSGLFTNAFLLEPRTFGITLGKRW